MRTTMLISLLLCCPTSLSASCWALVVQSSITQQSPIVVRGEIVKIIVSGPTQRAMDTAYIRVEAIHKNVLDYRLKAGDLIPVRMHGRQRQTNISTDLEYPLGKRANWYLFLESDGRFTVCKHLQQCRPVDEAVKGLDRVQVLRKLGESPKRPGLSIQQWLAMVAKNTAEEQQAR